MNNNKAKNPWQERFGWYHYDSKSIYKFTDEDFDKAAKKYRDAGITTIILFGAHFRFSYWAYWDDIVNFIVRFTDACHRYSMKVIEHHSSHLTYQPISENDWVKLLAPASGNAYYKDFRETSQSNPTFDVAHLDDFAQIDGSTGKPALSSYIHTEGKDVHWVFKHYNGHAHCFNNPAYENAYWKHIKDIVQKAHVDGIMNDDVQWFGGGNACACKYCRAKFKEETGYDLPYPDKWAEFFEHYEKPEYIAWKKFKKKSSGDFHRRMDAYYKSIGFYPMRPAYCAEVIPFDTTCYGFESASELWDYIFQECCGIIRYSYVCFAGEAIHRYAMAKRKGVPSMALMYPATKDSMYASWALCRSWGQMYTGTGGIGSELYDKPYRDFEKIYGKYLDAPEKKPDISFYFSESTRDYSDKDAPQKFMKPFMSYLESAYVTGLMCDMVFCSDAVETFSASPAIAAVSVAMIGDAEIEKLRSYAENGGRLMLLNSFAMKNDDGTFRSLNEGLEKLGVCSRLVKKQYEGSEQFCFEGKKHVFTAASSEYILDAYGTVIAQGEDGEVLAVCEAIGKGEVIIHPGDVSDNPIQPAVWPRGNTPVDASAIPEMKATNGKLLTLCLNSRRIEHDQEDLLTTIYETGEATIIHLVNTAGMLPEMDSFGTIKDPIPAFCDGANKMPEFLIHLNDYGRIPSSAELVTPESERVTLIPCHLNENTLVLHIPEKTFSGYALIILK
ncbi:MAG: Glyco-hydro-42M domain-containing protein [Xylanivirga thermophila]|jgi:hypothetical protein|uniref:hypothetical protein n=1 Tax=Xylanivirga thermophila TaxID=2496273 RepID=UPI00101CF37B|nr:hypothetical protein [Xylanivirga thermophila]